MVRGRRICFGLYAGRGADRHGDHRLDFQWWPIPGCLLRFPVRKACVAPAGVPMKSIKPSHCCREISVRSSTAPSSMNLVRWCQRLWAARWHGSR